MANRCARESSFRRSGHRFAAASASNAKRATAVLIPTNLETARAGKSRNCSGGKTRRRHIGFTSRCLRSPNENPPRISPGGPTSSAPSQLPVHPRSAALSRATVRYIGCNRDESMTSCRRMRLGGLADRARFGRLIDAPGHGSRKLCAGIHCAAVNSCWPSRSTPFMERAICVLSENRAREVDL
jgi:hypothetical protein